MTDSGNRNEDDQLTPFLETIYCGDCIEGMRRMPDGSIDLVFADPPFNIAYEYDVYDDKRNTDEYLDWSRHWTEQAVRVLKPTGSLWLAMSVTAGPVVGAGDLSRGKGNWEFQKTGFVRGCGECWTIPQSSLRHGGRNMSVITSSSGDKAGFIADVDSLAEQAAQLDLFVRGAAGEGASPDAVERHAFDQVLRMGQTAIDLFLSLQGNGDLGPSVVTEAGETLTSRMYRTNRSAEIS